MTLRIRCLFDCCGRGLVPFFRALDGQKLDLIRLSLHHAGLRREECAPEEVRLRRTAYVEMLVVARLWSHWRKV